MSLGWQTRRHSHIYLQKLNNMLKLFNTIALFSYVDSFTERLFVFMKMLSHTGDILSTQFV